MCLQHRKNKMEEVRELFERWRCGSCLWEEQGLRTSVGQHMSNETRRFGHVQDRDGVGGRTLRRERLQSLRVAGERPERNS